MTGAELRALRREAGFKSYELAKQMGVAPATMSRYEHSQRPISPMVEAAARWVCRRVAAEGPGQRLVTAIQEALEQARAS